MTEAVEVRESESLVLPSGVVVELQNTPECALALQDLRDVEQRIRDAKRILTEAIVEESRRRGKKTMHLSDELTVEVKGGERLVWDDQRLIDELRALGCPEDRLNEIVMEEVTYKVKAHEAARAARANPDYAAVIDSCKTVIEENPTVSVRRR